MRQLFLILLFIPVLLSAQEDPRYLEGTVPVVDGKVVFTREINVPSFSEAQIYQLLLKWGEDNYNTQGSRVAYKNEEKGEIAIVAENQLVFSRSALSVDRTNMNYRIIIHCEEHSCTLQLTGIWYEYTVSYQKDPERYYAEEWITDEYALNKKKTKLNRLSGKFRRGTIDFAEETFNSAANALGIQSQGSVPVASASPTIQPAQPAPQPEVPVSAPQSEAPAMVSAMPSLEGFMAFSPGNVPNTILLMLPDNRLQVQSQNGTTESDAEWEGINEQSGTKVCSISIASESPIYKAIGEKDVYRLSFSKPEDSVDNPWIVMDCRKQGESSEEARITVVGEILQVWIK